ncbi:MAG: ABC transporter permease [Eubacteriaceae bacterium]|jgi:putative aldouronate transport system permease protein
MNDIGDDSAAGAAEVEELAETVSTKTTAGKKGKRGSGLRSAQGKKLFLLILPFLILCFMFSYFPLYGWIYAFYDYRAPLSLSQCQFVGFKWFAMLFTNATQVQQLIQVLKNTFAMSLLGILTSFLPVLFAVFLNEIRCKWFKNVVQTLTTLPNFISWSLVYAIAFCLFSSSGMVNSVLQSWGWIAEPIKFLDSPDHVWLKMVLWTVWKTLGWGAIMYLAAIAGIDQEIYEAARVDGASRWQIIKSITIPLVMPTYFVMLMLSIANFLNNGMDQYFVFQNAFNKQTIQVLDLYVYNIGMTGKNLSLATAIGVLKSLVSVTLLMIVNFVSKKTRGEGLI